MNDMNTLTPLLTEFEQMRTTLNSFVGLLKKQNDKINMLDKRVIELEAKLQGAVLPNEEQALLARFNESSKTNRNLNEAPQRIAMAAYLSHVHQVPNTRIAECGLLSASKMHGLTHWQAQHLLDYCEISGVIDIYRHGLSEPQLRNLLTGDGYHKLRAYLDARPSKKD